MKNKDSTSSDTLSTAITDGHNTRTDMGMLGMQMQVLGHAGMPRYSIFLYPEHKTYVFNIIDTAAINSGDPTTYQVVRIGNETVLGYSCVHSKITVITPGSKAAITEDIWTSQDVLGYALLKKLMSFQHATPKMMQAMDKAGCGGFFVKMDMQSKTFFDGHAAHHGGPQGLSGLYVPDPCGIYGRQQYEYVWQYDAKEINGEQPGLCRANFII